MKNNQKGVSYQWPGLLQSNGAHVSRQSGYCTGVIKVRKTLAHEYSANSCYFRSSVEPPNRKALIQITERCNLFCAHCFVSSGDPGRSLELQDIRKLVVPKLRQAQVESVTLTGGEPFIHQDIIRIVESLVDTGMRVTICTNATLIVTSQIESLSRMGSVEINVSLDGFTSASHGVFRGNKESFLKTIETTRTLGEYGLLKGFLVTPNSLARVEEYARICRFAADNGARYVLMNPLTRFGRGVDSQAKLGLSNDVMQQIRDTCSRFSKRVEIVFIRFPNTTLPLSSCEAGTIFYVFTDGSVAACPYIVFAARTAGSVHKPEEFIVANIFEDQDLDDALRRYQLDRRQPSADNSFCAICQLEARCGKGCPAAIILSKQRVDGVDLEMCPAVKRT